MKKREVFSGESMVIEKLPAYFLFGAIAWVAWNLFIVVQPFLMVLIFSGIIATVTFPIYDYFEKSFKGRKRLASVLTSFLVIVAIVIPLILFLLLLAGQVVDLYNMINSYFQNVDIGALLKWEKGNIFFDLSGPYSSDVAIFVQQNIESLRTGLTEMAKAISAFATKQSAKILTDVILTMLNLLFMFFTLYFLYKDGRHILRRMMIMSPIPVKYEKELFRKFNEISKATLFGTFLTAIAQGFVAWIGFVIAGVPNSFVWATAVSIFSLVPAVGTALVWIPMGLIMLASGNPWGLFILIWGASLVSTVDNVLRVVFIGSTAKLNPLLTFVSVFGGILAFDLIGVIFGPMLLVLFFTLLHVYELEYSDMLGTEQDLGLPEPSYKEEKLV
jgi:predicted PurR-regulated permease PerM